MPAVPVLTGRGARLGGRRGRCRDNSLGIEMVNGRVYTEGPPGLSRIPYLENSGNVEVEDGDVTRGSCTNGQPRLSVSASRSVQRGAARRTIWRQAGKAGKAGQERPSMCWNDTVLQALTARKPSVSAAQPTLTATVIHRGTIRAQGHWHVSRCAGFRSPSHRMMMGFCLVFR